MKDSKYEEALERAKQGMPIDEVFPELKESEDERIRKDIIGGLMWQRDNLKSEGPHDNNLILPGFCLTVGEHLSYLERQKENTDKEYVFRPLAGTDITVAVEQAIKRAKEGDHLVLAFNGMYLSVGEHSSVKELIDEYEGYLDRQKKQNPVQSDTEKELVLHDTFGYEEGRQTGQNEGIKLVLNNPEKYGLQKEHQPAEWSEEDEEIYNKALDAIYYKDLNDKYEVDDALKALCDLISRKRKVIPPYARWKPSEEQMLALKHFIGPSIEGAIVAELYDDLQKRL